MTGIRLHPNYHRYKFTDPAFAELLHATARGLIVQIAVSMEDTRTQHPLVRVPPVDLTTLPQLIKQEPRAKLELLAWWPALRRQTLQPFVESGEVFFDIATVEGIEEIARLMDRLPPESAVFGSNFPLFSFDAALLKMREAGLAEDWKKMLLEGNARRMPPGAAPIEGGSPWHTTHSSGDYVSPHCVRANADRGPSVWLDRQDRAGVCIGEGNYFQRKSATIGR